MGGWGGHLLSREYLGKTLPRRRDRRCQDGVRGAHAHSHTLERTRAQELDARRDCKCTDIKRLGYGLLMHVH